MNLNETHFVLNYKQPEFAKQRCAVCAAPIFFL